MSPTGDLILLEEQDRSRWNHVQIEEGKRLVAQAFASRQFGAYTIQAAIAAIHADANTAAETDWEQIVGLYDLLMRAMPSPVIELNRSVAVAMSRGYEAGLELIESILHRGDLAEYHLAHAARADLCRRLGRTDDARKSFEAALALTKQEPERRFLQKKLAAIG